MKLAYANLTNLVQLNKLSREREWIKCSLFFLTIQPIPCPKSCSKWLEQTIITFIHRISKHINVTWISRSIEDALSSLNIIRCHLTSTLTTYDTQPGDFDIHKSNKNVPLVSIPEQRRNSEEKRLSVSAAINGPKKSRRVSKHVLLNANFIFYCHQTMPNIALINPNSQNINTTPIS